MFRDYLNNDYNGAHKDYEFSFRKCPNCGRDVNSLSIICPFCQIDFRDTFTDERCGGCGQIIRKGDTVCPSCGFEYEISKENGEEASKLCDKGFRYIEEFRIKDAKVCFNRALKLNPHDVNPIVGNAYCLYHLGYYVLSLKNCEQALKMDSDALSEEFYDKVKSKVNEVKR